MPHKPLVLASTSRYRGALLARLNIEFERASIEVDERPLSGERPEAFVRRLAQAKAAAGAFYKPAALVVGADQCAVSAGTIVGKPGGFAAALAQLEAASGRTVVFHTGVCVLDATTGASEVDHVTTVVHLKSRTRTELSHYLRREEPYDCAGAFKAEGLGIALLERIDGPDPTALIGLPLIRLAAMLERAGLALL